MYLHFSGELWGILSARAYVLLPLVTQLCGVRGDCCHRLWYSDKHYVTSPKETLTGFFVGCKMLQTVAQRRVIMSLSYQYSLLYLHHTRIQTACCLTLSLCSVVTTIKIVYNIFINLLTPNAHSMRRTAQLTSKCCILYRVSQEECEILRESVPYVKLYRYNPKHLYPKLNG